MYYNINMKILQLNTWMGKIEGNLRRFLETNQFDVICMQEVFASQNCTAHLSRLCFDLSQILRASKLEHYFFSPNWGGKIANGDYELGNLIISRTPFVETYSEFINGEYHSDTVLGATVGNNLNIQIVKLADGLTVVNHHGFWRSDPIGDEDTIKAFTKVGEIVGNLGGPVVLCGDLNIVHESPAMRPLDFLRDLTYEYQIDNTLSGLKFNGKVACDHIMVNDQVEVKDFQVLPDLVSDHLAVTADLAIK